MMRPIYSILPLGLIIIVAIGIYALHFVNAPQIGTWHDDAEYVTLGESFAVGQPYRLINYPDAPLERVYPPGYPLFILAPAWLIGSGNLELLRASSLLLAIANIVLLFFLARRHMQGWQLYLTVALFAWHPAIAAMAVSVMSETAFLFFVLCYLLTVQFACQANEPVSGRRLVLAAVLLAVATLIRYQGIALILGSIVWLICLRRWRSAVLLAGFVFIIISPFLLFLYENGVNSVWSMTFVEDYFRDQIPSLFRDVTATLANFWHALGFAVWPLIGPRLMRLLGSAGLWWIVAVVNTAILALVSFNLLRQIKNKQLHGIFLGLYALISVLVADRTHGNSILDEDRYLSVVLPFIYLGVVESLGFLASFKPLMPSVARAAPIAVATILLSTLLWRNGLDIASQPLFSIVDLSTGAAWIQSNSPPDAIVMAPDPISRHLYLRRRTIDFPASGNDESFLRRIRAQAVDFVFVAPPVTLKDQANVERHLTPFMETVALPLLEQRPEEFEPVYVDNNHSQWIFRVHKGRGKK